MTIEPTTPRAPGRRRSPRIRVARRKWALAVPAVAVVGLGGCGDDGGRYGGTDPAVDSGTVEVSDAWARSSPAGVTDGVVYLTIESAADDQLTGVSVPADVAATVELHETVTGDGEAADDSSATMTMQQVSAVDLPAGEPIVFGPGGLHVMLIGLAGPLESGSSFEFTLTFAEAEPMTVTVDVSDEAP